VMGGGGRKVELPSPSLTLLLAIRCGRLNLIHATADRICAGT
jgi:hypothetical protein